MFFVCVEPRSVVKKSMAPIGRKKTISLENPRPLMLRASCAQLDALQSVAASRGCSQISLLRAALDNPPVEIKHEPLGRPAKLAQFWFSSAHRAKLASLGEGGGEAAIVRALITKIVGV